MYEGEERRSEAYRISKIEGELSTLVQMLAQDMKSRTEFRDRIENLIGAHSIAIYGDNAGVGLNSRVSTLEEAHKNHRNNLRVIYVAMVGVVINALWKILPFVK